MSGSRGTVLVVGGRGFIGSNLVQLLLDSGFWVRVLDLRRHSALAIRGDAEFVEGDFTNQSVAHRAIEGIDVVIHLASITTPQSGTSDPIHDVTENLVGTLRLLEACQEIGVRRVVFASSGGTVYGRPERIPIPEDHPEHPINSYGIVKLAIEKYLTMYSHLGHLDPFILRPSNPYGPGQYPWGNQGAVAVALGCIRDGKPFQLWGDGSVVRDYLYVDDLARAFLAAVEAPTGGRRIFNVGSGRGYSLLEILDACRRVTGKGLVVERFAGRPIDTPVNVLDSSSARDNLGWAPVVGLEDGLERTWRWIRQVSRAG